MTTLVGNINYLCVAGEKLYIFNQTDDGRSDHVIDYRSNLLEKFVSKEIYPDCCVLSPCGNKVIMCVQKEMLMYSTETAELLASTNIEKTASCVRFFHQSDRVLVADRSGCVWFYTLAGEGFTKESTHLGHNSVLTDALISENDNYVITCDRDEKIRVSHYPNVYNIQSFCLGHEEFVSSISFLPSDASVLLSSSGDGTIRLWDYVNGIELLSFQEIQRLPFITAIACQDGADNLVVAAKYGSKDLLQLSITGNKRDGFKIFSQDIFSPKTSETTNDLLDIAVIESKIVALRLAEGKASFLLFPNSLASCAVLKKIETKLSDVKLVTKDSINMLFKRRFNCLDEYHARKKARLDEKYKNLV